MNQEMATLEPSRARGHLVVKLKQFGQTEWVMDYVSIRE